MYMIKSLLKHDELLGHYEIIIVHSSLMICILCHLVKRPGKVI
jgi:hypothetical protein